MTRVQSLRPRFLAVAVLATLYLFAPPLRAGQIGPATALKQFKINNPFPNTQDFHLKFRAEPDENLKVTRVNNGLFGANLPIGDNTPMVTVNWAQGFPIGVGNVTLGVEILQESNQIRILEAWWTSGGGVNNPTKIPGGDVALPGFKVAGDPEYTMFNDLSQPIGIRGLQFLFNVPPLPFETLDPGVMPGFGPTLPDFVLAPMSSIVFNVPGDLDPGMFLYAQASLFDVTSGETIGSFIDGHQAPVPEPSTLILTGLGLLVTIRAVRVMSRGE